MAVVLHTGVPAANSCAFDVINSPTVHEPNLVSAPKEKDKARARRTNQTKQAQYASKHLHDEDLDKQRGVGGVCEGRRATCDPDTKTTNKVTHADRQTTKEEGKAWNEMISVWSASELGRDKRVPTGVVILARVENCFGYGL